MMYRTRGREETYEDISPLTEEEFESLMSSLGPFEVHPHVAVAVSGGADSMALTLLLKQWVQKHQGKLWALTVDHGLRAGSSDEARCVQSWMKAYGISHEILEWRGEKPQTRIQEKARRARHALLENYCRGNHILHLFLGHHLEDQVETFWLRFLRKSGTDGLAAMPVIQKTPFLRKIRPCLTISKARLGGTLKAFAQEYIKDPSNENRDFHRVKIRSQQEVFENLGLTSSLIQGLIQKNTGIKDALWQEVLKALLEGVALSPLGYVILDGNLLRSLSFEISRRVLERAVMCVGGREYPPRWESLIPILENLRSEEVNFSTKTLGQALLKMKKKELYVMKEQKDNEEIELNFEALLSKGEASFLWNERFLIGFSKENWALNNSLTGKSLVLKSLGRQGRSILIEKKGESGFHPWEVLESLPSLWEGGVLVSVPHLKWGIKEWISYGFEEELFFYPKVSLS